MAAIRKINQKMLVETIQNQANHIKKHTANGKVFVRKWYEKAIKVVDKKPLISFFTLLGLLFLFIIVSNIIRQPKVEVKKQIEAKKVEVYHIGTAPRIQTQALIEKSGVVQIVSQTSGIVQKKYVSEGQVAKKGQWLFSLSSNYQGGNALSVARQLSQKQDQIIQENYPLQKELVSKQRELADRTKDNFDQLKDITNNSKNDTQSLIDLNNDIISNLDANINALSATTSASANASLILATKQLKSQFSSANLQLNTSQRNMQYQTDSDNPPTKLAELQHDIAQKQLDIQDKALDLNKDISQLQVKLAEINEGLMYPSAPFAGKVERILVREGQLVNPGTLLLVLSGSVKTTATATIFVSKEIAIQISLLEPTIFTIGSDEIKANPTYISQEATQGNLYSITYTLPEEDYSRLTDKSYITASLPIGYAQSQAALPYVPLDAVYQTQENAYIFVLADGKAANKTITLGSVFGRFVAVNSGISAGDVIILDRTVLDGDALQAQ
jgi:multidrug efflux pump subunit AcrA (membrane-fusion protein)